MNEFCWNIRPNILQAFLTFGFELNTDTTCGFLPENKYQKIPKVGLTVCEYGIVGYHFGVYSLILLYKIRPYTILSDLYQISN